MRKKDPGPTQLRGPLNTVVNVTQEEMAFLLQGDKNAHTYRKRRAKVKVIEHRVVTNWEPLNDVAYTQLLIDAQKVEEKHKRHSEAQKKVHLRRRLDRENELRQGGED